MHQNDPKIVVGIDFSSESRLAAEQALRMARHLDAELVLVNVRTRLEIPPISERAPDVARDAVQRYREQEARWLANDRDELAKLRERLSGQGVLVSQLLVDDSPESGLCAAANQIRARLTVVGTQGRTGLRWLLLGSVAQRVVRMSAIDVLVARPTWHDGYHRILVATDYSSSAERALDGALAFAAPGAEIDVVHCHGRLSAMDAIRREEREALADELRSQGEQLLARKARPGVELHFHVSPGFPMPGIVHWLETHHHDLVAVGSHGLRGIRRGLLGSVSESVVRHAPCSVLVAHDRSDSSRGH
jgi:nucleotide-binding universal stress UspA family protein